MPGSDGRQETELGESEIDGAMGSMGHTDTQLHRHGQFQRNVPQDSQFAQPRGTLLGGRREKGATAYQLGVFAR